MFKEKILTTARRSFPEKNNRDGKRISSIIRTGVNVAFGIQNGDQIGELMAAIKV